MAATIKDIAKKTGLGLATISTYINGGNVRPQNKQAIDDAIEELGYKVNELARGLKTNKTKTIGVIIPEITAHFYISVISVLEEVFRSNGYAAIITDCHSNEELEKQAVEFLVRKRVDGIVNIPVTVDGSHLKSAFDEGIPVVFVDRILPGVDCDCVLVDNVDAVKKATELLIANKHKHIGGIFGPNEVFTTQERLLGYKLALLENGIMESEAIIVHGEYTTKSGIECMEKMITEHPEVTAVVVTSYEIMMGAVIALNQHGLKIPEDISFIGFDNPDFARTVTPELYVVTQPISSIAEHTANIMLERLNGNSGASRVVRLSTMLEKGNSILKKE